MTKNSNQELVRKLQLKNKQYHDILNAATVFNSNLQLNYVIKNVLDVMCDVIGTEAGTLWLIDAEKENIRAEAANGPSASKILNVTLKLNEGIVGQVIMNNQSNLVKDVKKDPNWAKRVDQESGFITRSLMTVPISIKGNAIGAIQFVNKKGDLFFDEEDVNLTEALANQAALAIHNSQMYNNLQRFSMSVIRSLTLALDARDPYTAGHSRRVGLYSVWIAQRLNLTEEQCIELERAALMHDIGKIAVPDYVLQKPSRLTEEEFNMIKSHTRHSSKILSEMEPKNQMKIAQEVARYHHEKINGSGYPDHLKGDEIPLFARIVAVADAFDAMTTDRPYSKGRTYKEAVEELIHSKHQHFDPEIVDVFAEIMSEKNFLINKQERTINNELL